MGGFGNTFGVILRCGPPGLMSWTIPIPKQHSKDITLATTGLLCGVTVDMCVTQRTQQHVQSKIDSMLVHCDTGLPVTSLPLLEGDRHRLICHAETSNVDIQALLAKKNETE